MDVPQQAVFFAQTKILVKVDQKPPLPGSKSTYVDSNAVDFCFIVQKRAIAVKRRLVKHGNLLSQGSNHPQTSVMATI